MTQTSTTVIILYMETICVTGAEGFIGSHLVEKLLGAGHRVKALIQYNSFNSLGWLKDVRSHKALEIVAGDVRDASQMLDFVKGSDRVIHLAALIAIPHSYSAPDSYFSTNVQGTLNLLNASKASGVKRFVHTSTSEVYGSALQVPISEDHPLQAQSPYSASKIGADALAHSYWSSFELPVVILRPFNTFGPRQSFRAVIPTLLGQLLSGVNTIQLGATSPTRDFTFVDDTVEGFMKAMLAPGVEGQTINLGTGFEISISDLVHLAGTLLGRDVEIQADEARLRPLGSEVDRLLSDNSKAAQLLGWEPQLVGIHGLKVGLQATMDWLSPRLGSDSSGVADYVR